MSIDAVADPRQQAIAKIREFVQYATGTWMLHGTYYRLLPADDPDGTPWLTVENGTQEDLSRILTHGRKVESSH